MWKHAGVHAAVGGCGSSDRYGGVAGLQLLGEMEDSSSELQVLTHTAVVVMNACVVQEHFLPLVFLPVKELVSEVPFRPGDTGQNRIIVFSHNNPDHV